MYQHYQNPWKSLYNYHPNCLTKLVYQIFIGHNHYNHFAVLTITDTPDTPWLINITRLLLRAGNLEISTLLTKFMGNVIVAFRNTNVDYENGINLKDRKKLFYFTYRCTGNDIAESYTAQRDETKITSVENVPVFPVSKKASSEKYISVYRSNRMWSSYWIPNMGN